MIKNKLKAPERFSRSGNAHRIVNWCWKSCVMCIWRAEVAADPRQLPAPQRLRGADPRAAVGMQANAQVLHHFSDLSLLRPIQKSPFLLFGVTQKKNKIKNKILHFTAVFCFSQLHRNSDPVQPRVTAKRSYSAPNFVSNLLWDLKQNHFSHATA